MFFTYVCLHRCKRFSLKGTQRLEIRPTAKTQMVLGSNGSGKSSLLRLGFSVLPPSKKDFYPGGYRHSKVAHNGHHYELRSTFDGNPEHSFIRDGVELNVGKTETVQRELVREHFRMTQDIHNLLTGHERFTAMSPARRRDWITQLSSSDFDYVLGVYNKVKKGQRDAAAVVKHNTNRLTVETAKLRSEDEILALTNQSKQLRDELNELLIRSNPEKAKQYDQLRKRFDDCLRQYKEHLVAALRIDFTAPNAPVFNSVTEVEAHIARIAGELHATEGSLHTLGEEFELIEREMAKLASIEGVDEASLRHERSALESSVAELRGKIKSPLDPSEIVYGSKIAHDIEKFMEMLREIPSSQHNDFSDEAVDYHRRRLEETESKLADVNKQLWNIQGRLEHIERCQTVDCPSCNHRFKPGIGATDEARLLEAQAKGTAFVNSRQPIVEESKHFLREAMGYQEALRRLYSFRQSHPNLSGLWKVIDLSGGFTATYKAIEACQQYLRDTRVVETLTESEQRLKIILESLSQVEALGGQSQSIRERYAQMQQRIGSVTQQLHRDKQDVEEKTFYLRFQKQLDEYDRRGAEYRQQLSQLSEELIESIAQMELLQEVRKRQVSLAMVEQTITECEVQQGIVNDIQKEIDSVGLQEQAYRLLMETLSPSDGLIAEQIGVFINAVIDRMNAAINRTWGYNLSIKSCDVSSGDLDYRFPLYAIKEANEVPDVSMGSDSQVDIVNQAFRLIAYQFLHLDGYPLYLDELGRTFDEVHRHNLVPVVKDLIEDDAFSQVFIISHFADGQGSYQNGQLIVLDDSHLNLKTSYNEHVVIET